MARSTIVRHERAVGTFILLAAALLGGALVLKGARVGLGAREVMFVTDEVHDLKRGARVTMRGIEVGEVTRVELTRDNTVEVRVKVYPDYLGNLHADAVATIVEPPLLGASSVEISPGGKGELVEGAKLRREQKEGLLHKVQAGAEDVSKVIDRIESVAEKAQGVVDGVAAIVSRINRGEGLVGRLVTDEKLADDFVRAVRGTVTIVEDAAAGRGAWAVLRDESFAPNLKAVIADVRSTTDAIAEGKGSFGRLVSRDNVVVEAEGALKDLRSALARLDEIQQDARATTTKVQQVLETTKTAVERFDGTIKNAEKMSGELAGIAEKINKGDGTLAKLVNDDAVYKETKALLKELRESVEDLREQAPINAFIGVVFSAF